MMIKHGLTATVAAILVAMNVQADEQRTRLTHENEFPDLGEVELGINIGFLEFGDNDEGLAIGDANLTRVSAEARVGLLPNLTLSLTVPYDSYDPDVGEEADELGDVEIGLQLLAYEDIFDYKYIIPYVNYDFGNGEPYLLPEGYGDDTFTLGVAFGTVTYDVWTWVLDISYDINGETENSAVLAGSLYYDFSDQFSMGAEANIRENQTYVNRLGTTVENAPIQLLGGMVYQATKNLEFAFHGGGSKDSRLDTVAMLKTTYTF